jgi:uncharacterized membrane protein YjfL (UPF0719 family)
MTGTIELRAVAAGLIAYGVSVVLATLLVFGTYKLATILARVDDEKHLASGHRSIAIVLGAVLLSQALLLRHAVFPIMAVVRELFLAPGSFRSLFVVLGQSVLFALAIAAMSCGSVALSAWLFTKLTGALDERAEIRRDNVAVAILFGFALLAVSLVLSEGVEDVARALVPIGPRGFVRVE